MSEHNFFGMFQKLMKLNVTSNEMDLYDGYFANFYDKITGQILYDIDYYLHNAEETKSAILELACGSGRLLLEFAKRGYRISGLDLSPSMLNVLEKKISSMDATVKENISVCIDNMVNFQHDQKYGLIILGATSICLLDTDDEIDQLLENVYRHLEVGGRFIFDYSVTSPLPGKSYHIEPINIYTEQTQGNKQFVIYTEKKVYTEMKSYVNFYGESIDADNKTTRNLGYTVKRLLTDKEISAAIKRSKFKIINTKTQSDGDNRIRFVTLERTN
ncbi:methyltransferase domain-containing protein [Neobacillus sp. PS3-40]|uniref:class I SAM-dependent DNA methyltransferase n=1 Tax=Neobacillus sp. PS3-40 TaxID=3070679 RepID=UPI0027DF5928|nr:methyltransferase domain-containing protein [Neobacillus sp. PS3-40]WML46157.1 methyltransferase domain-containing protein [Neobacillus sp. PS3-40]